MLKKAALAHMLRGYQSRMKIVVAKAFSKFKDLRGDQSSSMGLLNSNLVEPYVGSL